MSARATYRKTAAGWEGVVVDASGAVVIACGHDHWNRDASGQSRHLAARACARGLLREVDPEAFEASLPGWQKGA